MSKDSKLRARDILVLSPKPEIYAPLMAGVLMLRKPSIGFSTAGVEGSTKSPLADLAVRMLELPSGRFTSQEILEICELSVIRDHFGWESDSTYRIRRWFESAPFYWGMDDLHRERLTGDNFNNWSALDFINKVSLGTAMRSEMKLEGEAQTIPLDDLDGREDLRLAAGLIVLIDRLRMWSRFAQELRQPLAWVKEYAEHLEALLPDEGESAEERVHIERALAALQAACAVAGEEPIDLATFRTLALPYLDFDYARGQFLGGGVTLSSLRAGNIHPAKVIAFIGMSDGAYPPRGVVPGPELKTERPTEAERSRDQSEQRGMHTVMLAISAARSRLILTFPGFAGNSGKDAAAALPVELIRMAAARICPDFKVQRHGLHSHEAGKESSDDHFGKAATLTLDTNALDVAAMLAEKNTTPPIPTLEMDVKGWTFEEWLDFWRNPVHATNVLSISKVLGGDSYR
jgi:exodeoxyribonuclease V gamma subunit